MSDRTEKIHLMVSSEELEAVETFRFNQRLPNRSAAVRELLRVGLAAAEKQKSQAD
jgi:hypothetical protein